MPGVIPFQSFNTSGTFTPAISSTSCPPAGVAFMASSSSSMPSSTPDAAASLQALEALLTEFFAPSTRNERKREIEALLNDFGAQRDSWKQGFYFLANTNNEYVMMYSMTVIENVINKRWQGESFKLLNA